MSSSSSILRCVLLSVLILPMACKEKKVPPPPPVARVSVQEIIKTNIPIIKTYIGITQSIATAGIRARVQGFLTKMNFVEGKPVKKGQLLYVIDPKPFQAKLDLAQGQLSRSIAEQEFQAVEYQRLKQLVAKGNIAKSTYDETKARYQQAIADVQIQNAQVTEAQINLSYCSMYAPFDSIIGEQNVDVGNLVGGAEDTLLATVVQLDPIYVLFSPSVKDFSEFLKYRANMPFKVEANLPHNPELIFKGKVNLINNQADTATSTVLMRAEMANPKQLLLPGIYVNLRLFLNADASVILVPSRAVLETQGARTVYIFNEGIVENRNITVSGQYENAWIVTSGLKVGEQLVTSGLQKLKSGDKVTLVAP